MILTGDLIIASAKRGISFPSNNSNSLSDEDILAFAYEEVVSKICPILTSIRQEFLIAPIYTITIAEGTQRYRLPQRALARTLRNVIYVDASLNRRDLTMTTPEESLRYMPTTTSKGVAQAFYVENDYLVIVPIPNAVGPTLEITYPLRPSQIIKVQDAATIQTATPSSGTIVLNAALATITTSTAIDIISATSGSIVKTISITPTNVASETLTFAVNAFGSDVIAGDYLCLAEQTPVAQIPEEAHVVLARATQNRILEAIDDLEGLAVGQNILMGKDGKSGLLGDLSALLTPRVEGKKQVVLGAANRYFLKGKGSGYYPRIRV